MTFLRPEAKAALLKWREVIIGLILLPLAMRWLVFGIGLTTVFGGALLVFCLVVIWIGFQRARFRTDGDGLGAVQVDEGQITYFSPLSGGSVSIKELERLSLDASDDQPHWLLDQKGVPTLRIPVNASGSDALFDAFATLPGLQTERMLTELRSGKKQVIVIWERSPMRPIHALLH